MTAPEPHFDVMNPPPEICKPRIWLVLLLLSYLAAGGVMSLAASGNPIGSELRDGFVWTADQPDSPQFLYTGFRREFELEKAPARASLHLFAYTRYRLYVNGEYVGRGPNRFENVRPEYDTWDVASRLHSGRNVIAVLVSRDWSRGSRNLGESLSRMRRHAPGFTAQLAISEADGKETLIRTDGSWKGFTEKGFAQPPGRFYSSIPEAYDARAHSGDWWAPEFDGGQFPQAVRVDVSDATVWPVLSPRTIPLLRETEITFQSAEGSNPAETILKAPRIVQAYWTLDIEAEAGAKLVVTPLLPDGKKATPSSYICRAGRQRWIGGDTFAFNALSIRVESGQAKLGKIAISEVLYPFERVGSFTSSDVLLNQIWALTARSLEVLSEDAYTDCGDRERSEWMDCDPPMYDASRVMMAGPDGKSGRIWSDPRLFANMLRRVAYTQEPDGMLKARTCSELIDIHTRMEDRACDWVDGLRKYYEATGDKELIRELWPYAERLLEWFAQRRTANGLVKAREWIAWDNPMSYAECEGAANNAFIWRAFSDAAYLAQQTGNAPAASKWQVVAAVLAADFDKALWDEKAGAYSSSIGTPEILPGNQQFRKSIKLKSTDGRTEPTLHANLFALDRGIVPPQRRAGTIQWTLAHEDQIRQVMANYYFFKILYALDEPGYDRTVLARIRKGWKPMVESPWQTTWESGSGGSKMHCYGIVPGPVLSSYVLGVRRDRPVWERKLIIEPHLTELTFAKGTVVTEFGAVPVSWNWDNDTLHFELTIPDSVEAELALPDRPGRATLQLDGKMLPGTVRGARRIVPLTPGVHRGEY